MRQLLGRDDELTQLEQHLDRAERGDGNLCLLVGEPGIGKTRLADELAARAVARGIATTWGRAWDGGGAPAYWPWLQALDGIVDDAGRLLSSSAGTTMSPELQFRMFRNVADALREATARTARLVILDDVHAADHSSLLLLQFVSRELKACRLCIACTYRDVEARLSPEIGRTLARVAREGTSYTLARLDRAAVSAWFQATAGRAAPRLESLVFRATQGNPLFVDEVVRLLVGQGITDSDAPETVPLPFGVREAIRQRLDLLPAQARAPLEVAATLGAEAELALTARAAAVDAATLEALWSRAVDAGVLVEVGGARYRFGHALMREVLVRDLPATRRRHLHLQVANAIEAGAETSSQHAQLAHHLFEAGEVERAATHAERAARSFVAMAAFDEAAALLELALAGIEAPGRRADVALQLAEVEMFLGKVAAGKARCEQVAALARSDGDARLFARAALIHGLEFHATHVDRTLVALLEDATAMLGDTDPGLAAQLMARLASARTPSLESQGELIALGQRAIAQARALDDPAVLVSVLSSAMGAFIDYVPPGERAVLNREIVALYRRLDRPPPIRARLRLFNDHVDLCEFGDAERVLAECEEACRQLKMDHYLWRMPLARAELHLVFGRFAEAEAAHQQSVSLFEQADDPGAIGTLHLQRWGLLITQDRPDELVEHVSRASTFVDPRIAPWLSLTSAAALSRAGHVEAAKRKIHDSPVTTDAVLRLDVAGAAMFGDVAVDVRDLDRAARAYDLLAPHADRSVHYGMYTFVWGGLVRRPLGRVAALLGRWDEAIMHFEAALARTAALGARPHHAHTAADYGDALASRGDADARDRARVLWQQALETARALDMPGLIARCERQLGGATRPAAPRSTFSLQRDHELWTVRWRDQVFHVKSSRGLELLDVLVAHPGEQLHCLELAGGSGADRGDAGELIDRHARDHYRQRMRDLEDELAEAETRADLGRVERARDELEALTAELARGLGLGGTPRRAGSATERARSAVQRRLRDAIKRIRDHAPELGELLDASVKTGTYCSYQPVPGLR